jgi:hypothetical protein
MSNELVDQLTLNLLISKTQLQKLNKKIKDNNRKTVKEIYGERIKELFSDLLVDNKPEDLLQDVETGFQFFLDKCIYYFKVRDTNKSLEEDVVENVVEEVVDDSIKDDIDYDKEDDIDYDKEDIDYDKEDIDNDKEDDLDNDKDLEDTNKPQLVNEVVRKSKRYVSSDSLPLDWFQRCKKKSVL